MTCPSLARPADYSLANNMAIAQAYAATHGVAEIYSWFQTWLKAKGLGITNGLTEHMKTCVT